MGEGQQNTHAHVHGQCVLKAIGAEGGVTQTAVHPGIDDATLASMDSYLSERRVELSALCDAGLREYLAGQGVSLTDFQGMRVQSIFN